MSDRRRDADLSLSVDAAACAAHGICAHVMADRVTLDPWGFAIVDSSALDSARLVRKAKRAAKACPARALRVTKTPPGQ
ncbi:MAG TPA: ferredoxin [Mycobacteriales bacterium]|nr:ferredoxin [Mycobacteriales bacterium]